MGAETIRYLSRADVRRVCPDAGAIADRIEQIISAKGRGSAWEGPKSSIAPGPGRQWLGLLSGAEEPSMAVFKTLGLSVDNAARGLPHIGSLMVVHDGDSGMPVAVMDADHITGVRTASVSLIAARRMARPDSRSIALIGCGVQAQCHFDAFREEFPIERVVAYSRRRASTEALCAHATAAGCEASATTDASEAIRGVDMVVSTIPEQPGLVPFLDARLLAPGVFISAVDLGRSWIPGSLPAFDRIAVEDLEKHAAAPLVTTAPVDADLAGILDEGPRANDDGRNAFIFRGFAFGDLAAAALCLDRARADDVGTVLPR